MAEQVLITGGAGFIGSHLGDELLRAGYRVRALHSLVEQVHGDSKRPEYLADGIELVAGDVRNPEVVRDALEGVDSVVHLAARVGGPIVYEDGGQRRDFVNVADVARACRLALERDGADGRPVNVARGRSTSVLEIAETLARVLGKEIEPELAGQFRAGDIRHCFADVTLAREALGFEAEVQLEDGMAELAEWLEGQDATDRFEEAADELTQRGLTS